MARIKKIQHEKSEGKISYGERIVDNIVTLAVSELPYVELYHKTNAKGKNSSVVLYFDKKGVDVDITVKIHYSQRASETVFAIQEAVRHSVESMTDYKIQSVNVVVVGVLFDEAKIIQNPEENDAKNIENKETVEN